MKVRKPRKVKAQRRSHVHGNHKWVTASATGGVGQFKDDYKSRGGVRSLTKKAALEMIERRELSAEEEPQ